MAKLITLSLSLVLTLTFAVPAAADTPNGNALRIGQTVTVPLEDGGKLVLATTGSKDIGRGLARTMGDPSSYIWTTAYEYNAYGWVVASYSLRTDFYWDSGRLMQVSPFAWDSIYAPGGYSVAYNSYGWYWTSWNFSADSWGQTEIDSYLGQWNVQNCTIHLDHFVNGWGGAWGSYWKSGC